VLRVAGPRSGTRLCEAQQAAMFSALHVVLVPERQRLQVHWLL